MPANTRQWAKREIEAAIRNMETACGHILRVADLYSNLHPEVSGPLVLSVESMSEVINMLRKTKATF